MSFNNSISRTIIHLLSVNGVGYIFLLLISIIIFRSVDKTYYGLYVILLSLFAVIELLMAGFNDTIVRFLRDVLAGINLSTELSDGGKGFTYGIVPEVGDVMLWNNDYYEVDDHTHCVDSADELENQYNFSKIWYKDFKSTGEYNRFMVIGRIRNED